MTGNLVPRQLPIVGPPHLVRQTLETQQRQGRLVGTPDARSLRHNGDGTVTAYVTVLVDEQAPWRKRHAVLFGSLITLGAIALLFSAGWLMVRSIAHAITTDGPLAMGSLIILGGLLLAALANRSNRRGPCPGVVVHCRDHKH